MSFGPSRGEKVWNLLQGGHQLFVILLAEWITGLVAIVPSDSNKTKFKQMTSASFAGVEERENERTVGEEEERERRKSERPEWREGGT